MGLRVTLQRLVILQVLRESGEHLDAKAIHTRACIHLPDLGLATVYRNLKALKDAGLVIQQGSDALHTWTSYETTNKQAHHHFVCVGCGKIVKVPTSLLDLATQELARRLGAVLTSANLEGYCKDCKKKAGKSSVGSQSIVHIRT
jgi:Fe2+ or Zn2+ uptake regulation protein